MKKVFIVLLAACVVGAGCGKKISEKISEKIIEKKMEKDGVKADVKISGGKMTIKATGKEGKTADIDISGDKVTVKSEDGTAAFTAGKSAKLPDGFPKDVYVYDGATVATVMTTPDGCNVSFQTKDSAEKVTTAYKSKMTANGWTEESAFTTAQQTMIAYKKNKQAATVMILAADGTTQINLTVVTEKR